MKPAGSEEMGTVRIKTCRRARVRLISNYYTILSSSSSNKKSDVIFRRVKKLGWDLRHLGNNLVLCTASKTVYFPGGCRSSLFRTGLKKNLNAHNFRRNTMCRLRGYLEFICKHIEFALNFLGVFIR